jgi:hypothetical protein
MGADFPSLLFWRKAESGKFASGIKKKAGSFSGLFHSQNPQSRHRQQIFHPQRKGPGLGAQVEFPPFSDAFVPPQEKTDITRSASSFPHWGQGLFRPRSATPWMVSNWHPHFGHLYS